MSERGGLLLPIFLTIALFFSGFFVFLTPLPLVFFLLRRRGGSFFPFAIPSLFLVLVVYVLGVQYLPALYESHPAISWLLPVPGLGLLELLAARTVVIIGIVYFGFYILIGYVIYSAVTYPARAYQILFGALIACFLVGAGAVIITGAARWQELLDLARVYMTGAADEFIALQAKADLDPEQLIFLKQSRDVIVTHALALAPVFFFNALTFLMAINLIVTKRFFTGFFPQLSVLNLGHFQMPFFCVWIVILLIAVLLGNHRFLHDSTLHFTALNLLLAFTALYLFQGLAVFVHFLDSRKIFGLLRLASYLILFLFFQSAWLFLAITGFFDNWLDLRKLNASHHAGTS